VKGGKMTTLFNSSNLLESRLYKILLVIARLGLGYLFFTQLWWKLPPRFGCGADFAFPVAAQQNYWEANNSSGLCFWMGMESIFASRPRRVLVADMRPAGLPTIGLSITPLARLNGVLIDNLFMPQIRIFGWLIWLAELSIAISMLLGLFTRLGSLIAIGMSLQLYVGLANIPRPYEWEWSYGTMVFLSLAMFGAVAGRTFGVDGWLRRRLTGPAEGGNRLAKIGLLLS
jgi:uncharacterized membrane protein YphA (DoxX/SURF4 family)